LLSGRKPSSQLHPIVLSEIDLPGRKVFDKAVIAPDANYTESDFQGTSFTGVFDGNGYTISHRTIAGGNYLTCEAGMMCGIAENRVPEWRATLAVCQNGGKKRVLDVRARLFGGSSGMVC
jgi:hypothetical protein